MTFQRKRLIFNPQNPCMTVQTWQPQLWSFQNFLLGWLSRISRMHPSDGSFLLHWQESGLRAGSKGHKGNKACTSCTPTPHTKNLCKSAWSRGRGVLLYFTHMYQSVPHRFYCTRRWNWLGRDDQSLVVFFFFLPFSVIASGYCIFKPVLIALNMHIFT